MGVDDPDVNLVENYTCKSDRNYTGYCNEEVDKLIFAQSREIDPDKKEYTIELETKSLTYQGRTYTYFDSAKAVRQ